MTDTRTTKDKIEDYLKDKADPAQALIDLVDRGVVTSRDLFVPAIAVLKRDPDFAAVWRCAEQADAVGLGAFIDSGVFYRAVSGNLCRLLISEDIIPDSAFEFALTTARQALLVALTQVDAEQIAPDQHAFLCALAQQCFLNEYAYWEKPDETLWVDVLRDSLEIVSESGEPLLPHLVALFACYRPVMSVKFSDDSLKQLAEDQEPHFARFFARTMTDPRAERALMATFKSLTDITDDVSKLVRLQYEENPYPRWFTLAKVLPNPNEDILRAMEGVDVNQFGDVTRPRILVAGCGTGGNIITFAGLFANADITAVDLSRASLAHAKLHCDRLGLTVRYAHADILELASTGLQFDIIECAGVLHHMKDPLAGGRALEACLRPGGVMRVGLYSQLGRDMLAPARLFIERGGYAPTPEGIRRFRRDVMVELASPQQMKFGLSAVTSMADFYSVSMCRDLVFHVQERGYTIPQIKAFSDALGLRLASVFGLSSGGSETSFDEMVRLEREGQVSVSLYQALMQKPA